MPSRQRNLLIALGLLLAALAGLYWANRPAAEPVSLVSATVTRCVIDLVDTPRSAVCDEGGSSQAIPGTPTRWLVFESRGESTIAGWAEGKDAAPAETVTLVEKQASRVAAWPVKGQPDRIGVSTAHGYGEKSVAHQLSVTVTP